MSRDGQPGRDGRRLPGFLTPESDAALLVRDVAAALSIGAVAGLVLFAISGVWPPLVAVESESMEPHLQRGDLVFVSEPDRFTPEAPDSESALVPADAGRDIEYQSLGDHGSVVVYAPPGWNGSPIIHRAHRWVEEGENWYQAADTDYLAAESCRELRNCPAPHAGLITKGDANPRYDQAAGMPPVRPEWVSGTAHARVPYLGWIRLTLGVIDPAWLVTADDA